jgi:hypothetical protein
MSILAAFRHLRSACTVFFGPHGAVTAHARHQGRSRQALYREADHALQAIDGAAHQAHLAERDQQLAQAQASLRDLEQRLTHAVEVTADHQAAFAATAQAVGVSLSQARALRAVFLGAATPSVATLGRLSQDAGRCASAVLEVLDTPSRARARQIAADEIFSGRQPVLMTLEQDSLCWLGGRRSATRDAQAWAEEFRALPAAEQVTADGAVGLRKGLAQVNAERQRAELPVIRAQRDHFHALHYARRAAHQARHRAKQALDTAERLQRRYEAQGRAGVPRTANQGGGLAKAWAKAEQAFDHWSAQEATFQRLRQALRLFTPQGALNTRARAEAEVRAVLAGQTGANWARARRLLGPAAFAFLDRVQEQLAQLSGEPALRQAAVWLEGLRRRPEALEGAEVSARAARGLGLVATAIMARAEDGGQRMQAQVRAVLQDAWRASSLVEGLNSVVRMQQRRQKRLTQGLLDLKRLYWNMRPFRAGKRKHTTPYGRLGLALPPGGWWDILQWSPDELRQELARRNPPTAVAKPQELSAPTLAA